MYPGKYNTLVRPVVTLALTSTLIYGFVVDKIGADVFVPFVTLVVTWYFKERDKQHSES